MGSNLQSLIQNAVAGEPVSPAAVSSGGLSESEIPAIASIAAEATAQRERRFELLVIEWKVQRNGYSSDPLELAMCIPYQKIIAMGPEVVPLILRELEKQPDHWFWALNMLTDSNPIAPGHRGDFSKMVEDWLRWGRENGFLPI